MSAQQVEAHCKAEKERLIKSDAEKGKVHAGAVLNAAAAAHHHMHQHSIHPAATHGGAVVSAAALVTDGACAVAASPAGSTVLHVTLAR
jgi:hypothetical protein